MADWDISHPGDTDIVATFPANERAARTALQTNFSVDHQGTVGSGDIGKHLQVTMPNRGSDPGTVAGQGNIYSKLVAAQSELFWRSSTGAALQLTSTTGLNLALLPTVAILTTDGQEFTGNQNSTFDQIIRNTSTAAAARSALGVFNSAGGVFLQTTSTGFSGSPITSAPAGEQSLIYTTGATPLSLGTNSTSRLSISGAGVITLNGVDAADYARLSVSNLFTASGSGTAAALRVNANPFPFISWRESGAAVDNRLWDIGVVAEQLRFRIVNDAEAAAPSWMTVDRTGTTIDTIAMSAVALSFTGAVATPGTSASEVGYQGTPQVSVSGNITMNVSHNGKQLYVTGAAAVLTLPAIITGFACTIVNNSGGNITIIESASNIYLAGAGFGAHGTRTLAYSGMAYVTTLGGASAYIVSGTGVS